MSGVQKNKPNKKNQPPVVLISDESNPFGNQRSTDSHGSHVWPNTKQPPYHVDIPFFIQSMEIFYRQNCNIINSYHQISRIFSHQIREHEALKAEIQSILSLKQEEYPKMVWQRTITMEKLNMLRQKLTDFQATSTQYDIKSFKKVCNFYQGKNNRLFEIMKYFNKRNANQFVFSQRLLMKTSPDTFEETYFMKNWKIIKNRVELRAPQINLAEPRIGENSSLEFNKIKFKINCLPNKFIYLGAIKLQVSAMNGYQFDRKLGNGAYVIAGNSGYSFSNDYQEENLSFVGFNFGVGDVVEIEYDSLNSVLKFTNYYDKKSTVTMNIKRDQYSSSLHFCAITIGESTEVQIMSDETM